MTANNVNREKRKLRARIFPDELRRWRACGIIREGRMFNSGMLNLANN